MAAALFALRATAAKAARGKKAAKTKAKAKRKASKATRLSRSIKKAPVKWRIPKGARGEYEAVFEDLFGQAPRGATWNLLAERYPERFRDYLEEGIENDE